MSAHTPKNVNYFSLVHNHAISEQWASLIPIFAKQNQVMIVHMQTLVSKSQDKCKALSPAIEDPGQPSSLSLDKQTNPNNDKQTKPEQIDKVQLHNIQINCTQCMNIIGQLEKHF